MNPKLMSWNASWSGRTSVASEANSRSRSWRSDRSEVSSTTSASRPDGIEAAPLLGDRAGDPALVAERVAVACLAEAPDEDVVAGLQEDDPGPDPATLERPAHGRHRQRRVAGPDVEDDRDPGEALAVGRDELGEIRQELAGQVVDDGVAEVLEELRGGRLASAGQPADDDDRRLGHRVGRRPWLGVAGHRPLRRMNRIVSSNRTYIVMPSTNGLTRSPPGVTTAEKIAMPRMTIRRIELSRCEVTMPDHRQPDEQDRELHDQPEGEEHRGHEVEVLAGGRPRLEGRRR